MQSSSLTLSLGVESGPHEQAVCSPVCRPCGLTCLTPIPCLFLAEPTLHAGVSFPAQPRGTFIQDELTGPSSGSLPLSAGLPCPS